MKRILRLLKTSFLIFACGVSVLAQNVKPTNVGRVLLGVNAYDFEGEPIVGLRAENFSLFENGKQAKISSFSDEDVPFSVGFLLDNSPSMEAYNIDVSRKAVLTFIEKSNANNEYFVTTFNKKIDALSEFAGPDETTRTVGASPYFAQRQKNGKTVLYEAVLSGIEKMSEAKNQGKVLFVFWDSKEDYAFKGHKDLERLVKEKNIVVYLTGIGTNYSNYEPLSDLAELSGGEAIYKDFRTEPARAYRSKILSSEDLFLLGFSDIAKQLRHRYVIGFDVDLSGDKGGWQELKVKIDAPEGFKKRIKTGYIKYCKGYYPSSAQAIADN